MAFILTFAGMAYPRKLLRNGFAFEAVFQTSLEAVFEAVFETACEAIFETAVEAVFEVVFSRMAS